MRCWKIICSTWWPPPASTTPLPWGWRKRHPSAVPDSASVGGCAWSQLTALPEDIKAMAPSVLAHRLAPSIDTRLHGRSTQQVLATLLNIREIDASRYFETIKYVHSYNDIGATFRLGKIRLAVVFPPNFRDDLLHTNSAEIQLIADASDPNTANTLTNYATAIINDYQKALNQNKDLPYTIKTQLRMMYNPELKSAYNFVPGVMALVLMLVCAMMTSIAIVREKELGTMEVILVSPLKPFRIIIAKTIPYLAVSMLNIACILLLSVFIIRCTHQR